MRKECFQSLQMALDEERLTPNVHNATVKMEIDAQSNVLIRQHNEHECALLLSESELLDADSHLFVKWKKY